MSNKKTDKRIGRKQTTKLSQGFFPLDMHKTLFINDKNFMIPKYYVESWDKNITRKHRRKDFWEISIKYTSPKPKITKLTFKGKLRIFDNVKKSRSIESSYRINWSTDFSMQLAKDYPKSFVRSLEFQIGDEYYKNKNFTEYDIGGFKEQLQVKIEWKDESPEIHIKELFKVRKESQDFPHVYDELSEYLINDHLLSSKDELRRRIQVSKWRPRKDIFKALKQNIIYLLLNREKKEIYFGETKKSLSERYPEGHKHHSFEDWSEFLTIELPEDTPDNTRLLIERVLIETNAKLFANTINNDDEPVLNNFKLMNKKK